jgi:hypothetical protein
MCRLCDIYISRNTFAYFLGSMPIAQPQLGGYSLVGASAAVAAGVGAGAYDHANGFAAVRAAGVSGSQAGFDALSDKDSVSLHAHSITASHVEKTLSEVASSLSAPFPRPGKPLKIPCAY